MGRSTAPVIQLIFRFVLSFKHSLIDWRGTVYMRIFNRKVTAMQKVTCTVTWLMRSGPPSPHHPGWRLASDPQFLLLSHRNEALICETSRYKEAMMQSCLSLHRKGGDLSLSRTRVTQREVIWVGHLFTTSDK